jgi:4-amino-4-deoxy-L-arabinose transferase-like glycosyltransferase
LSFLPDDRRVSLRPSPALVTQTGARRLPRVVLWLLGAAYVLPGLFGRDPWRNADLAAFGQMAAMAEGRTSWWAPALGQVAGDTALLPHWLGAAFIALLAPLAPFVDAAFAARVPFALLLAATLALVWYTTFHLARTEAAQPVPFAFGGGADPVDYARAMADGALLALIATLGLLQLGHETTPELAQLAAVGLLMYGLAGAPYRRWIARLAVLAALPLLAGSGAPSIALLVGLLAVLVCWRSRYERVRPLAGWVGASMLVAATLAWALGAWRWRAEALRGGELILIARQWLWFMWPAWPLALWTLWRWRRQLTHRHISVPLVTVLAALAANLAMNGFDRALLLALPGLAVLAAFALPTFKRSATAAIDWFSMCFFTLGAAFVWVMYAAMHTGLPAKPAANLAKLAPDFVPQFSWVALLVALAGTLAWFWGLRWRTSRQPEALWKSLVLPAGGVALCWLLAMTLLLPILEFARSPRTWVQRIAEHVPPQDCVAAPSATRSAVAALEHFGRWQVDARPASELGPCGTMVRVVRGGPPPVPLAGWTLAASVMRPTERDERTHVYRRTR